MLLAVASHLVALGVLALVAVPAAQAAQTVQALPVSKIYGVNIGWCSLLRAYPRVADAREGGWLVSEPWLVGPTQCRVLHVVEERMLIPSETLQNPVEWISMGGENCNSCTTCRGSEGCVWLSTRSLATSLPHVIRSALALFLGQNATDAVFQQHWFVTGIHSYLLEHALTILSRARTHHH